MTSSMCEFVVERLAASRGKWPEIVRSTGVPIQTISRIALRQTTNPRINTVERLAAYFRVRGF